jgi:hypothetical protein
MGCRAARRHVQGATARHSQIGRRAAREHVHNAAGNTGADTGRAADEAARENILDTAGVHGDIAGHCAQHVRRAATRHDKMGCRAARRHVQGATARHSQIGRRAPREHVHIAAGNTGAGPGPAGDQTARGNIRDTAGVHGHIAGHCAEHNHSAAAGDSYVVCGAAIKYRCRSAVADRLGGCTAPTFDQQAAA